MSTRGGSTKRDIVSAHAQRAAPRQRPHRGLFYPRACFGSYLGHVGKV